MLDEAEIEIINRDQLFGKALAYIDGVAQDKFFGGSIYQAYPHDPILQSGWFEKFKDENGFIDVELGYEEAIVYAKSIDELPPKLKAFVLAVEQAYK